MKKLIKVFSLLAIISAFGINTLAQTMNEDFRKNAPEPLKPVPFNVPTPFETTLSNGLKIVIVEDRRLPLVSYRLALKSGDASDPKDMIGLTSAVASMLNEGTRTRTSKQLADEVERLGANVSANSTSDNTVIGASTLSAYKTDVLNLMADMVLNPTFPKDELELYNKNTIQGLKVQRSDAGFLANEQISKILFGLSPYSIISPKPEDIEKLTPEKLKAFHEKMFVPGNATLIIVGDVDQKSIINEIKKAFGNWKEGTVTEIEFAAPPERKATTITLVDRPGSAQSNIILGNVAINRNSPDYFKVLVMNQVLGAGPSARLFLNLREDKGYTYGAYSSLDTRRQAGTFEATAEVRTPVTGDSLKEFFYELRRIRDEKVSEKELRDAKNFLTGVFPIRAETQEGLTNLITNQQLYNLPDDYLQTYRDKINAVTLEDVAAMAKKYITPDELAIVIVGDVGEILPQVKSYANNVEIFDTEGVKQDIATYENASTGETADVNGTWNLELEAHGQKLPVTLELKQEGVNVVGSLDSQLGKSEISEAKVNGNKFVATAKSNVQGQEIELSITGTVEGNTMKGTVNTGLPGFPPLPFEGNRENKGSSEIKSGDSSDEVKTTSATNVEGKWTIKAEVNGQPVSIQADFKNDDNDLSGTITSPFGDGQIKSGKMDGNKVEAVIMIGFQGQPLNVKLKGKMTSSKTMEGTLTPEMPGLGDLPFTATRD